MNETNATAIDNITRAEKVSATTSPDVQGIWKASLGENEIVMAMNQSAESIYGQAKFEGDNPWNAAVAGSISQNSVFFSLAAREGEAIASTFISATVEGDSMKGFFIRFDSIGKASQGDFTATMISPEISGYTPAATSAPEDQTMQESAELKNETREKPVSVQVTENRFKDVTQLAKGINPDILPRMAPL